jgi:drug/metabolite transporter (DMT)-like permease
VPDSLLVRLIGAEPMVTAFWRGMISGLVVFFAIVVLQGPRGFLSVIRSGWPGLIYVLLIGSTTPAFVLAVANTSVANVVFIFASTPIFAAVFSRLFLGEPIRRRLVLTMAVVIIGLGTIAYGSGSTEHGSWKGDLWAVYVSAAYAAALTAVRKVKEISMIPAIPIAYIGGALVIGMFHSPIPAFELQWPLFMTHGFLIGAASCLLTLGPRFISSAEVSLLILLESVLAPILVWAVIGENPGQLAIMGGTVVIGALVASNLLALWSRNKIVHEPVLDSSNLPDFYSRNDVS